MRLFILPVITLMLSFVMPAQADTHIWADMPSGAYTLDKSHSSITWKIGHLGLSNYTARFTDFNATLDFDSTNPANSTLTASINPLSIETDYPGEKDFNQTLGTDAKWFNGGEFPAITFESSRITQTGPTTGVIEGTMSMLGVKHPFTLDVTMNGALPEHPFAKKPALGFSARGTLNRSDWGMNTYIPEIDDKVEVLIEVEMHHEEG